MEPIEGGPEDVDHLDMGAVKGDVFDKPLESETDKE